MSETSEIQSDRGEFAGPGEDGCPDPCTYVVGIGASAGGLEALEAFFNHTPEDTGAAFVVVQHLSPDFKSHMESLLARQTGMRIRRVENGMAVEANTIYLIPPRKVMVVSDMRLLLTDADPQEVVAHPIDHFFRALAQDLKRMAVAVVLSGTGSDGARGLVEVRKAGGLTLVQDPGTARFDGMPLSALGTDQVDLTLPPETMGQALSRYIAEALSPSALAEQELQVDYPNLYDAIFDLLQAEYKINFADYKAATIGRRVQRRLAMRPDESLDTYVKVLSENRAELDLLYHDLLIGVTRFFRDPEAYAKLAAAVLPELFKRARRGETLRIWVPGCATGEEAYSLAILLTEGSQKLSEPIAFKIFATDVHQTALTAAARGVYPADSLEGMHRDRRERFFTAAGEDFRVKRSLRETIVFARHNLLEQPPFTQMDMVSCRNLLIYFQAESQRKVLSLFHFALKTDGHLLLGPSETLGGLEDEFVVVDKRWRVYRKRRDVRLPHAARFGSRGPVGGGGGGGNLPRRRPVRGEADPMAPVYERLLENHMPPSLLVDENLMVVHLFGGVEKLLALRTGRLSTHVLDLVDDELRSALSGALHHAARDDKAVRYSGLRLPSEDGEVISSMVIEPVHDHRTRTTHFVIRLDPDRPEGLPDPSDDDTKPVDLDVGEATRQRVNDLETELQYARENLQATVEELETSNEELQASNEELVASNEELQSTNEELHSVNEELYTFNAEYQQTIDEVRRANDDMDNLMSATGVGVIFLDQDLTIRKFTPQIARTFNLVESDTGRSIETFAHNLHHPALTHDVRRVIQERRPFETEITDAEGRPYFLRVLPYADDRDLDESGAVLTLLDLGSLRDAENDAAQFKFIADHGLDRQCLLDPMGRFVYVNHAMCRGTGYAESDLIGKLVTLVDPDWPTARYRAFFEDVHKDGPRRFESVNRHRDGTTHPVEIGVSPVEIAGRRLLFANSRDITERQAAAERLRLEHDISMLAADDTAADGGYERFLPPFLDALGADVAEFWSLTPGGAGSSGGRPHPDDVLERVHVRTGHDLDGAVAARLAHPVDPVRPGVGRLGRAWQTGACCVLDHAAENGSGLADRYGGVVPVRAEGRVIGMIAYYGATPPPFPDTLRSTLEAIGRIINQLVARRHSERDLMLRNRAIESTRDGIVIADATHEDLPLIYVNRGFEEITGYTVDEVRGRNCRFLQGTDRDQIGVSELRKAIRELKPCQVTLRNYRKNGEPFYNDLQVSPVADETGRVVNFVAVQHDVTDRIAVERRLEEAVREAAAASVAKSEFVANISHEIRTPMTAIMGFADALGREVTSEKAAEYVGTIRRNGDYLLSLINDLLDLSKIEAGKLDVALKPVELPALMADINSLMQVRASEADLPLAFKADAPVPAIIQTDRIRLRQVLVNLISNALKFTPEGHVEVVVEATTAPTGRDGADRPVIRFHVTDTGIGIPEDQQKKIFRPFAQVDQADAMVRLDGGTGLGLSISKRLVQRMGGRLLLDSEPGQGSTFTVELPTGPLDNVSWVDLEKSSLARPADAADEVGVSLDGMRVLVADDRRDVARVAKFYLEESGARVETVANGREAVDAAWTARERDEPYDVILMDMQMPVMTGFEATAELRNRGYTGGIVALTAGAMSEEASRTLDAGCDKFLAKPVEEQLLIRTVSGYRLSDGAPLAANASPPPPPGESHD